MKAVVLARCVRCGKERTIEAGEIPAGSHPMCDECFMPMVAKEARFEPEEPTHDHD